MHWLNAKLAAAYNFWKAMTERIKEQQRLIRLALMKMVQRDMARAMALWRYNTTQAPEVEPEPQDPKDLKIRELLREIERLKKPRCDLNCLKNIETPRSSDQETQNRALAYWKNLLLARGWNSWIDWMIHRMSLVRIAKTMRNVPLAKAFRNWRSSVGKQGEWDRMLMRRGVMRFLNFDAAAGFMQWREIAGMWRRESFLVARCIAKIRGRQIVLYLNYLREYTEFKRIEELEFQMFLTKKHLPANSPRSAKSAASRGSAATSPRGMGGSARTPAGLSTMSGLAPTGHSRSMAAMRSKAAR